MARLRLDRGDRARSECAAGSAERIFTAVFHPDLTPWSERGRAFNISMGQPLAQAPVVAAALGMLTWAGVEATEHLDMPAAQALIGSPFLAGAEAEGARRARWQFELRRGQRETMRWEETTGERAASVCPQLAAALRSGARARAAREGAAARRSYGAWGDQFARTLQAMGWPGERASRARSTRRRRRG